MSIDIDKNFIRKSRRKRGHRSKPKQAEALEIMKNCLINGESCKFAAYEAGFQPDTAASFFKRHEGMTMSEFQRRFGKPKR